MATTTTPLPPLECGVHDISPGKSYPIQSPKYPKKYLKKSKCKWELTCNGAASTIERTAAASTMELSCDFFNTQSEKKCYKGDYVKVSDGTGVLKVICGKQDPFKSIVSNDNVMTIQFATNGDKITQKGFSCNVKCTTITTTTLEVTSTSTTIASTTTTTLKPTSTTTPIPSTTTTTPVPTTTSSTTTTLKPTTTTTPIPTTTTTPLPTTTSSTTTTNKPTTTTTTPIPTTTTTPLPTTTSSTTTTLKPTTTTTPIPTTTTTQLPTSTSTASISTTTPLPPLECGVHDISPGKSYPIQSPKYPKNYLKKSKCKWELTCTGAASAIERTAAASTMELSCDFFHTQNEKKCYKGDYLKVSDSTSVLKFICGKQDPFKSLVSNDNLMKIQFVTNGDKTTQKGFSCNVKCTRSFATTTLESTSTSDSITTTSFTTTTLKPTTTTAPIPTTTTLLPTTTPSPTTTLKPTTTTTTPIPTTTTPLPTTTPSPTTTLKPTTTTSTPIPTTTTTPLTTTTSSTTTTIKPTTSTTPIPTTTTTPLTTTTSSTTTTLKPTTTTTPIPTTTPLPTTTPSPTTTLKPTTTTTTPIPTTTITTTTTPLPTTTSFTTTTLKPTTTTTTPLPTTTSSTTTTLKPTTTTPFPTTTSSTTTTLKPTTTTTPILTTTPLPTTTSLTTTTLKPTTTTPIPTTTTQIPTTTLSISTTLKPTTTTMPIPTTPPPLVNCGVNSLNPGKKNLFVSPKYPKNYAKKAKCTWEFTCTGKDSHIELECDFFNTQSEKKCINGDYVRVTDGTKSVIGNFCGKHNPFTKRVSSDNYMKIRFITNGDSVTKRGFSCSVKCIAETTTAIPNVPSTTPAPTTAPVTTTANTPPAVTTPAVTTSAHTTPAVTTTAPTTSPTTAPTTTAPTTTAPTTTGPTTTAADASTSTEVLKTCEEAADAVLPRLPCKCGVPTKPDNTNQDSLYNYPWTVALLDNSKKPFCSGTIINTYHVLTSKSCATCKGNSFTIRANEQEIGKGLPRAIQRFPKTVVTNGDLGLIKMDNPISLTNYDSIKPACLPTSNKIFTGYSATHSGYDHCKCMKNDGAWTSGVQPGRLKFIPLSQSFCRADQGGPIVSSQGGKYYLAGIALDYTCSRSQDAAKVSNYYQWIMDNSNSGSFCEC